MPLHAKAETKTVQIYVTVDWEGMSLEPENIEAIQAFRQQFPHIPMLQLLNPVYFIRDLPNAPNTAATMRSTFMHDDTHGLHIHAWKSLVNFCDIPYQHTPSFTNDQEHCETGDCGYTVSLEYAYSQADLSKLIACSSKILMSYGFNKPQHFRAGGWQLGPKLIQALNDNGFIWDSSRIDSRLLSARVGESNPIINTLRQLHPTSTPLEQPFALTGTLTEYPNNASLADYTNTKQIVSLFKQLLVQHKRVMVLGFHQETAIDFLHRLSSAIPQIETLANEQGISIEWLNK